MVSLMVEEALAASDAVAAQSAAADDLLAALAARLSAHPPKLALTVARGSSDHAASYFAYLVMRRLGVPVVSLPMSLVTLHRAPLVVLGELAVALSQSGESPDLVDTMQALGAAGATTVAFVNQPESPLARVCQWVVPLCAGIEKSVAATKSYIASLAAVARLVAHWQGDDALLAALDALPEQLARCEDALAVPALETMARADRTMIVGRGLGYTLALEVALKLKETCGIQAEAVSSAELRHGPMALVHYGYPIVVLALRGAEQAGTLELARELRGRGARVILAAPPEVGEPDLPLPTADDEVLDPLLAARSFYLFASRIAVARGLDPDRPRHLTKVTRTH